MTAAIAASAFEQAERAWNQGDGAVFGALFADDTDFVDIRGGHHRGDGALIGRGHQALFDSMGDRWAIAAFHNTLCST